MHVPKRLLCASGRVRPAGDAQVRDLLRQLTPADAGSFFDLAASHQVLPQVHRQLARSADDASPAGRDLVERLGAAVAAIERSLDVHARALDDLAAEAVARVTAIKGAALARLYDESTGRREMRDVDLWTPTPSLWPLVAHLVDRGYGVHKVRVGQYGGSGAPPAHGICPLTLAGDDGGRDTVEIDLHFGAFPALGEGLVPLADGDLRGDGPLTYPSDEASLAITLAHAIRQGFVRLRDVNDVFLVLARTDLEVADMERIAREHHLEELLGALLRLVGDLYAGDEVVRRKLGGIGPPRRADRVLLLGLRRRDEAFTDESRVYWSRLWQARYLFDLHRARDGLARGVAQASRGLVHLFRSGRPYPLWEERRTGGLDTADRFVLLPIARVAGDLAAVGRNGLTDVAIERLPRVGGWVVNPGCEDEVVVTPGFLHAQTDYGGETKLPASVHARAERLLADLGIDEYRFLDA